MYNLSNSVTLMGNLGQDVEVTNFDNGNKLAKTSIAINRSYTNSKGEKVQEVDWHNLIAWNKTAELMERLLKKGSRVMVQGALKHETYKTKAGEIRYSTKVSINGFQNLSPKEEGVPF